MGYFVRCGGVCFMGADKTRRQKRRTHGCDDCGVWRQPDIRKGAPRNQTYPAVLTELTGKRVINLGVNGDTGAAAPRRLAQVMEHKPYMVLIEFGGNDFMRSVPFEQTMASVSRIVDEVQAAGAIAVIVDTGGYYGMRKYSKAYKKLAKEKGAVFVSGILDGVFGQRALMSDQVHPNAAGYKIVAERVYEEIKDYL